jgi:RNA polymerase sigma-70 factor (ECF subfamily)
MVAEVISDGTWAGQSSKDNTVRRAQAGDREAYGQLVERFKPVVYALAMMRLGNPTEAEDVAQEVFVHSMTKLGQLRDARCFAGWLRQIAVRFALGRLLRRGRATESRSSFEDITDRDIGPLEQLIRAEDEGRLHATLGELKPIDRTMLEAFYLRGRSLRQMSREFAAPIGTIKRRLHMARRRLRRRWQEKEGVAKLAATVEG